MIEAWALNPGIRAAAPGALRHQGRCLGQGRRVDRGLQHHLQALGAVHAQPTGLRARPGGREGGGLTMSRFSRLQGCASARPSPGRSSRPDGPCGASTWTGPALRRSHTRKRKGTKARSAHIRVSTGSRGTPRPCQLTPSLSILGASWERRSTGQLRSETVKRRKCSRLYTPDAQNARTRALDPLCSQLGPGCQVSRWYAPARGTVRADSNLAPGTAPSHVRTVRFKPFYLSPLTESNRRPSPYHGDALPTELRGQIFGCLTWGFVPRDRTLGAAQR